MTLKEKILSDIKDAMRAQDKLKLGTLRLISSAIKQIEVDERIDVDDTRLLVILDKMVKQRKESIHQYQNAGRVDLVNIENAELDIIKSYLPTPLSSEEIKSYVEAAILASEAYKIADMGKVMAYLKPQLQGRADMAVVSAMIKNQLTA